MTVAVASAPGKVILFGEHGVNRRQPAIAGAIDRRVVCRAATRLDDLVTFRFQQRTQSLSLGEILTFKREIDRYRHDSEIDNLRRTTEGDFFAPARYALAHLLQGAPGGLDIAWQSDLPVGAGLGSGAAAAASMICAASAALDSGLQQHEVAHMAWQGDTIAHGGIASGLDSGACALGGLTLYTLADGPTRLAFPKPLTLVVGDTLVQADTAEVNTRVRRKLEAQPSLHRLFPEMGLLVRHALISLEAGDAVTLGHLMNLNQLVLEKAGVSSPEIETLTEASLSAGALGAKLSGSGGGGIVVALPEPGREGAVAEAIEGAGGVAIVSRLGVPGVQLEPEDCWKPDGVPAAARAAPIAGLGG